MVKLPDNMPFGLSRLPKDPRGYPVPWFVDLKAPQHNGGPDFRIMDADRLKLAHRERRCWVCGLRITEPAVVFVAGPMCGINRVSAEPPSHAECAIWSVKACPFMSQPKRVRDDSNMPKEKHAAGIPIARNPGVTMLWYCMSYKTFFAKGMMFQLGEPVAVDWWCQGRKAERAEIMESVETGLPILMRAAIAEGPEAVFDLGRSTERFLPLVPA